MTARLSSPKSSIAPTEFRSSLAFPSPRASLKVIGRSQALYREYMRRMPPQGSLRVGLDHGQGFVHALALRTGDGALFSALAPIGAGDPARASALAIQRLLEQAGAVPGDISTLIHSSSAAAGAFAERETLPLGL